MSRETIRIVFLFQVETKKIKFLSQPVGMKIDVVYLFFLFMGRVCIAVFRISSCYQWSIG